MYTLESQLFKYNCNIMKILEIKLNDFTNLIQVF